jgi:hypothetical protein
LVKRIADADPELAKAAAWRQATATLVPQQLPASLAYFAGRLGRAGDIDQPAGLRVNTDGTVVISAIGTADAGKPKWEL